MRYYSKQGEPISYETSKSRSPESEPIWVTVRVDDFPESILSMWASESWPSEGEFSGTTEDACARLGRAWLAQQQVTAEEPHGPGCPR